jgi:hypothetical protein
MSTQEIKNEIDAIVSGMQECFEVKWSSDGEQSFSVIATEDTEESTYNGWLSMLFELQEKLSRNV